MTKIMNKTCENCKFWMSRQRDLEYAEDFGICTQHHQGHNEPAYKITMENSFDNLEHKFLDTNGTIKYYYCDFAPRKDFGCLFFKKG